LGSLRDRRRRRQPFADPWTRWSYAGANQPVAPISSPYELFDKLYGSMKEGENLGSVLDGLKDDIAKVAKAVDKSDRALLDQHATALRELERGLKESQSQAALKVPHPPEPGVPLENDSIPQITRLQTELLISAFQNDMARVSTFQFTNSVGGARMKWIGIDEGHHALSHDPDLNTGSVDKLTKINTWFAEQIAFLAKRLQETPEPDGKGNMLDNTTIVWTNELGKGNSHTLEDIPWVLIGGGLGFKTGRAVKFKKEPAQPTAHGDRPGLRPSHEDLRQSESLRRRGVEAQLSVDGSGQRLAVGG
jgi:hypothetical protein